MTPAAIKAFRDHMGWSQQHLASELGVDQATVSRMENGVEPRGPARRLLERLMTENKPTPTGEAA